MAANRAHALAVALLLASVGAAKARPARSDLGLGIGASGGFSVGLGLGLGGTGSAASGSGQGAGYSAWSGPSGGSAHTPRLATGRVRALRLRLRLGWERGLSVWLWFGHVVVRRLGV